jgi:hypothetical protein
VQEAKGRDELRIDVEAELAGQRMPQDPIWVERTLDELEQSLAGNTVYWTNDGTPEMATLD